MAANAPGPTIVTNVIQDPNVIVKDERVLDHFEQQLAGEKITCLLLNQDLEDHDITSIYLGTEVMGVNLTKDSDLAKEDKLWFKSLSGKTILSPYNIGFWEQLYHDNIPNANIIFQSDSTEYSTLLNYSSLPYFTTNLTQFSQWGLNLPGDRIFKPLEDKVAKQQFYACFLKKNRDRLMPVIEEIQEKWEEADGIK